jgi:mono/diheme cytochrome c family protein
MKHKGQLALLILLGISLATPGFAQQSGEATYKAKCSMCHGTDGLGQTPAGKAMKANSFKSDADVKASDADLTKITKEGKGKMPAYAGKLTDDQIQEVVTYIRTLQK